MRAIRAAHGTGGAGPAPQAPPACNTGGKKTEGEAIIDWLRVTFALGDGGAVAIVRQFSLATGLQVSAVPCKGLHAFTEGLQIRALHNLDLVHVARLSWGGESQRGRAELDISGAGCGCIDDWQALATWIATLKEWRITRCDVAVDLFEGECTVDDAAAWHQAGEFRTRQVNGKATREAVASCAGDWLYKREGRTLYVGKAANGKMLRAYEKGLELGVPDSPWVRFEVQFGNRDRVIPLDILTRPGAFFVAAYPCLQQVMDAAGERIQTITRTADATVSSALENMQRTYGAWVDVLRAAGIEATDLVEAIRVKRMPAKVQASAVVAGVLADTTKSAFQRWRLAA